MARERHLDGLFKRLVQTIEASLSATDAARDAVQEILRRGADTGIFFAGAKSRGFSSELTAQDKEFLRAVSNQAGAVTRARGIASCRCGARLYRAAPAPAPSARDEDAASRRDQRRAGEGSRLPDVRRALARAVRGRGADGAPYFCSEKCARRYVG